METNILPKATLDWTEARNTLTEKLGRDPTTAEVQTEMLRESFGRFGEMNMEVREEPEVPCSTENTLPKANRKRGSQPVEIGAGSAERLLEYLDEKDLTHLLPPVRPKIESTHLNPILLAPRYRKAFMVERSRYEDMY